MLSHLLPGLRAYLAENVPIWSEAQNVGLDANGQTVAFRRDQIVNSALSLFGQEGTQQYNQRLWNGSFVTSYTLHGGHFDGLSLSANCRFYGEATVGVPIVAGIADPTHPYKQKGYSVLGLQASYSRRLGKNYTWYGRVGIDNALDYDGRVVILARNGSGIPTAARWMEGTSVNFTNGIRF